MFSIFETASWFKTSGAYVNHKLHPFLCPSLSSDKIDFLLPKLARKKKYVHLHHDWIFKHTFADIWDFNVTCPSAQVKNVLKHGYYLVELIGIHFVLEYVDSTSV